VSSLETTSNEACFDETWRCVRKKNIRTLKGLGPMLGPRSTSSVALDVETDVERLSSESINVSSRYSLARSVTEAPTESDFRVLALSGEFV
jgi:hypothetical protein